MIDQLLAILALPVAQDQSTTETPVVPPKLAPADPEVKPPSLWNMYVLNADDVAFEEVQEVLATVFSFSAEKCHQVAMTAHEQGRALVLNGAKDLVESKLAQARAEANKIGCPQLPFSIEEA